MSKAVTRKQFTALNELYNYYNRELFNSELPECMVSIVRSNRYHGAFAPSRWQERQTATHEPIHEIVLNANTMTRPDIEWHSTLAHEMVHEWVAIFYPKRGIRGYHCQRWANRMRQIGLQASTTGRPGGRETGYKVSHYIIEGGAFEKAFHKISDRDIAKYKLPYQSLIGLPSDSTVVASAGPNSSIPEKRAGIKVGYECSCGDKLWGKHGLQLFCLKCSSEFHLIPKLLK